MTFLMYLFIQIEAYYLILIGSWRFMSGILPGELPKNLGKRLKPLLSGVLLIGGGVYFYFVGIANDIGYSIEVAIFAVVLQVAEIIFGIWEMRQQSRRERWAAIGWTILSTVIIVVCCTITLLKQVG